MFHCAFNEEYILAIIIISATKKVNFFMIILFGFNYHVKLDEKRCADNRMMMRCAALYNTVVNCLGYCFIHGVYMQLIVDLAYVRTNSVNRNFQLRCDHFITVAFHQ